MTEDVSRKPMTQATKPRTLVILAVLAGVLALVAIVVLSPGRAVVQNDPFVGTWKLTPPDEPGLRKFLSLGANGRFSVIRISDSTGKAVQNLSGRWRVDRGMMLLSTDDDDNLLRKLLGQPTDRMPVFLTGPDEFKLGTPNSASSFRRCRAPEEAPP